MAVMFPVLFWVLCALWLRAEKERLGLASWRAAGLGAALVMGLVVAAGTGALSPLKMINLAGLLFYWSLLVGVMAMLVWRAHGRIEWHTPAWSRTEAMMLILAAVFLAALAFLAVFVPPNSWDAMTYHMGRVAHWQFNGHVAYYPTHVDRQLWTMPLAEYFILHFQVLSGSDVFANMVQWVALVGCGVAASLLAGVFGVARGGQIATALITWAIPMGVLQSTSTQNDLVVALWLVCFVLMLWSWARQGQRRCHLFWAALAFALACFTKGTAYLIAPVFLVAGALAVPVNVKKTLGLITACLAAALIMAGPFHARNVMDYHNINPGMAFPPAKNAAMSWPLFVSNGVRQAGVHLQTPFQKVNNVFIYAIDRIHARIGVSPTDPRITIGDAGFLLGVSAYHEYYAGNFLHAWLGLLCCMIVFLRRSKEHAALRWYATALVGASLIFVLYLRWQPWISRLQLPLFILCAPVIGAVVSSWDKKGRWVMALAALLMVVAMPWVIKGKLKPVVGKKNIFTMTRQERYFINRPYLKDPFFKAAALVRESGCVRIGLEISSDGWEYPYWALLSGVDIRHVNVVNASRKFEDPAWTPCVLIRETGAQTGDEAFLVQGVLYHKTGYATPLTVYRRP